jgi:ribosome-binding protein aMBF1 (putative translation factor)
MKSLKTLKAELLTDPEARRAYDELAPEYEIARAIIRARTARGLTQAELAESWAPRNPTSPGSRAAGLCRARARC